MPTIPQTSPQVRTPPQGNPIGILAVSHSRGGGGVRNATAQGRNQGGSAAASPYGSALCRTYSTRNLNADAADEEADLVSRLRDGTQSTFDDTAAGAGNSPGGDDEDDTLGAAGTKGEPESKKRKVVAPYRQGCVGTLLYSTQKAKLLTELPPGTTLIIRSWEKREATNNKTGEHFINYNLTDIHGGIWFATNCFIQWRAAVDRGDAQEPDYSTHYVGLYKDQNGKYLVMLVAKPKKKTKPKAKKTEEHTDEEK